MIVQILVFVAITADSPIPGQESSLVVLKVQPQPTGVLRIQEKLVRTGPLVYLIERCVQMMLLFILAAQGRVSPFNLMESLDIPATQRGEFTPVNNIQS